MGGQPKNKYWRWAKPPYETPTPFTGREIPALSEEGLESSLPRMGGGLDSSLHELVRADKNLTYLFPCLLGESGKIPALSEEGAGFSLPLIRVGREAQFWAFSRFFMSRAPKNGPGPSGRPTFFVGS